MTDPLRACVDDLVAAAAKRAVGAVMLDVRRSLPTGRPYGGARREYFEDAKRVIGASR